MLVYQAGYHCYKTPVLDSATSLLSTPAGPSCGALTGSRSPEGTTLGDGFFQFLGGIPHDFVGHLHVIYIYNYIYMGLSENVVYPEKPNC